MVPFLFDKGWGSSAGGGFDSICASIPSQVVKPDILVAILVQRRERRRCSEQRRNDRWILTADESLVGRASTNDCWWAVETSAPKAGSRFRAVAKLTLCYLCRANAGGALPEAER